MGDMEILTQEIYKLRQQIEEQTKYTYAQGLISLANSGVPEDFKNQLLGQAMGLLGVQKPLTKEEQAQRDALNNLIR